MRRAGIWGVLANAVALSGGLSGEVAAQEVPLSVAYGPNAGTKEGDHDHREVIFFAIPADLTDRLYLRVFDPDAGGDHDLIYGGSEDTETTYTLFGGEGAFRGATILEDEQQLKVGQVLVERRYGSDTAVDGKWQTLAAVSPEQGELVDGQRFFRLLVEGAAGNDGNLFTAVLSLRDRRNVAPEGLEVFTYSATVRVPDERRITELRFETPEEPARLTVRNFDAANADLELATSFRSLPLAASGQDEWRETEVAMLEDERGRDAAIVIAGGDELPNDVTLEIRDGAGAPVRIMLPARIWQANGRPVPIADITPLASCFAVAFDASRSSDADGDRLTYVWDFGDGAGSEARALVHNYPGPGLYRATLRVTDSSGQIGNGALREVDVFVKRPPTAVAGADSVVTPGEPITFDGSSSQAGDRPILRYVWDFNDGTRAEGAQPTHVFELPGQYLVTLRVEDDADTPCNFGIDERTVRVNAGPVAEAGEDHRASANETVRFDGRRSYDVDGEITGYRWDFGDGASAAGASAEHAYDAPGVYVVRFEVEDDAGVANSTDTDLARVVVNAPPVAEAGSDRKVAIGEVVTFDASGSTDGDGRILDYTWNFGDGGSGDGQLVTYAYRQSGTYRVKLTVRDDSTTDTSVDEDWLTVVVNEPPVADAGEDQTVTASEVLFDGSRSSDPDGQIARYEWDFGDGSAGSGPSPTHAYTKPGEYLVRLTVTDDSGTIRSTTTDVTQVTVNAAPIADAGPDQIGAPGQNLNFFASGSIDPDGDVSEFLWDFKDGGGASGAQVAHTFEKPGVYYVRLAIRDDTEQESAIDFDEAKVIINAQPVANAGQDILAAPGDAVRFNAINSFDSDGGIASYRWDFSDEPEPDLGRQIVRAYKSPGIYTTRLTVTDDSGAINATAQDEVVIRINHGPVASAGSDVLTSNSTVTFDASDSADADGDPLTYTWDFGDGGAPVGGVRATHTYADGGTYPVVLTVNDGTGLWNATDSTAITVVIDRPPVAVAGGNKAVCAGDVVVFDGSGSHDPESGLLRYHWDFGDDSSADIVNPTKVYDVGKLYPVTLTVEDESGFPNNRHTDGIVVRVDESPIAETGPDQTVCARSEVHFDGSRSRDFDGVVNRFTWDFGDGTTGGGDRPVHVFDKPGDHRVVLTIEGDRAGQCDNTNSDNMTVRVVEAPVAKIDALERVAVGDAVSFDASGSSGASGRILAWRWDFGDGGTAEGAQAEHVFSTAGSHVVTLTIDTDAGTSCSSAIGQRSILVNAAPLPDAGEDVVVGVDQEVIFDASGSRDPDGAIANYSWDFGDGATASGMYVRHRFRESGRYAVGLAVTDDTDVHNNTASDSRMVVVNHAPVPVIDGQASACVGEEVAFSGLRSSDPDGQIAQFEWRFGNGATVETAEAQHAFRTPGTYDVDLVVDDGLGLNNSRAKATRALHANRPPQPEAGPDRLVCPGDEVTFDGSTSTDWDGEISSYDWTFGDGGAAKGARVTHVFKTPGLYETRLAVTDDSGSACAAADDFAWTRVNAPPVAAAGADRESFAGGAHDQILFDASGSSDADSEILSYLWDFGDGVTLSGEKVLHAFIEPGVYAVRLTASDGSGLTCGQAADELTVTIRERELKAATLAGQDE